MSDSAGTSAARDVAGMVKARFGDAITHADPGLVGDTCLYVDSERIVDVARFLKNELGFEILMDLFGLDFPDRTPRFEVVYNFYAVATAERLFVKVKADEGDPGVPSLTVVFKCADWHERECWDMFGVKFAGHPNLRRILMYEGFQGHPLRKDYDARERQPLVGPKD